MPSISKLSKLFHAVSAKDFVSAEKLALDMVSDEERKGHHSAAQHLKGSLHSNGHTNGLSSTSPIYQLPQNLATALTQIQPLISLNDVKLRGEVRQSMNEIIKEAKHQGALALNGLKSRKKLLFFGPPGCGKSLSAHALAKELSVPLYVVRFDSVIGAYLGQTATNLRELFRFAETTNCIMLIDEIDALGKHRGRPSEVGELDRIVIALMQELEFSKPRGLIIATSNIPEGLDRALWRRFDLSLRFPAPTKTEIIDFAKLKAKHHKVRFTSTLMKAIRKCISYSDAEVIVQNAARHRLLETLNS